MLHISTYYYCCSIHFDNNNNQSCAIGLKQQYKFHRSSKKRSDRIVQSLSIEMNSYLTKLIKSNHTEWKKWIKSNQITKKDYTTWVWLLWKSHEIITILFINNTLFWFLLNILLNESSGLTFWNRFGISNYNPYSLFRSTYQCHQNKNNRNSILQNCQWMFDLANPHSIISIISLLLRIVNEQESSSPIFLPYLTVSDITNINSYWFLLLSIIHRLMDNWFPNWNCLILCFHWFHFIYWQGIWLSILIVWNQWINGRGEKSWSSSSNNNKSSCSKQWTNIFLPNDSINNQNIKKHFKSTELMLSHNNQSFRTKLSNNQMVFIFSNMLFWIDSYIDSFIWIVWHWNVFSVFVCLHISSYSSIHSIQIVIQLTLFPESIY